MSSYTELEGVFTRLYRYQHLAAIVAWDQAAMMPPGGNEARGAALAELGVLMHTAQTNPKLGSLLAAAADEADATNDDFKRASVREMHRQWLYATALPEALVEAKSLAGSRCEHAWRAQRPANDWHGFAANLKAVVDLSREEAARLGDKLGLGKYDALISRYEPGVTSAMVTTWFSELKTWLPALIAQVRARQATEPSVAAVGPFDISAQRALGQQVMSHLGFDTAHGRLDVSTHPFCGGVPEDVRITTRYTPDDFAQSLMGIIHETGHARYEQGLPRQWVHLPIGVARSMAVHESQSLSFEMQLGRSAAFLQWLSPHLQRTFGAQPAFEPANLTRLYSRVKPGFIRVDADEVTYPMHIILRFEIERALIEGDAEVDDIPALWDRGMQTYLGIDTRGNFRDGPMQDIHWTDGSFGYFPSYTLGAMMAAQWFATIRATTPELDARVAAGDISPITSWLSANVWQHASRHSTDELLTKATGTPLSPTHFRSYLERKYLPR